MSTLKSTKIVNYIEFLKERFANLKYLFTTALSKLRVREGSSPCATLDPIACNSIINSINNSSYKGFSNISAKKFKTNTLNRSLPFLRDERNKVKAGAAKLQLKTFKIKINPQTLNKAAALVFEHLKLQRKFLTPYTIEEALPLLKGTTSAGFPWMSQKKHVFTSIYNLTKEFIQNLDNDSVYNGLLSFPTYVAYRVQQRPSAVKLRLIYVYSAVISLIEQCFLGPLLVHFLSVKTPYVVGNNGYDLVARWQLWQARKQIVSIDWGAYDWSAASEVIQKAFHILKDCFKLNPLGSVMFDFVSYYFINTPIITNIDDSGETVVIQKVRGIPSGSSFTNLIGTIVNLLVLYCFLLENGFEINPTLIAALGDDIVLATSDDFDLDTFANWAEYNFDMFVSVDKSAIFKPGEKVYFLGAYFDSQGRYINNELALYQIATTTSNLIIKCKNSRQHIKRIYDKTCSICFKYSDGYKLFDTIWPYIEDYLGVSYFSFTYTEVFSRATVPGSDDPELNTTKSFYTMRELGWLIQ